MYLFVCFRKVSILTVLRRPELHAPGLRDTQGQNTTSGLFSSTEVRDQSYAPGLRDKQGLYAKSDLFRPPPPKRLHTFLKRISNDNRKLEIPEP